ncbi:efflux RND transporter periplasmic adaptor subunit [uncultured Sphingomonas sp.]|uniref:efflux RND transporter periplasmic adaptor subunit n=1 Tax=uncultured Sphingomonas sp. TaxID=158754 RepID=UPI0035C95922
MKNFLPLATLALLGGCGSGTADDAEKKPDPIALVRTAPATLGAAADQVTVYGAAEAAPGAERSVIAPAEAIVARIVAPTGTAVKAGQAIVELRPSRTTATDFAKASSEAAATAAAFARAQRLRADGLVSDADVETARAAAQTAQAARAHLGMAGGALTLRAPVAGTVQGLSARTGDQIAAGAAIATIAIRGDLRARFGIDPALVQRIHTGQALAFNSVAGDAHATSSVTGVDSSIDATTHLASIYARVPAATGVGPGEPLRAAVSVGGGGAGGITIPYAALLDDGGRSYVFVVKGGAAHSVDVSPGNSIGDRIAIRKGLQPGDQVVTQGGTGLEDGMKVRTGAMPAAKTDDK